MKKPLSGLEMLGNAMKSRAKKLISSKPVKYQAPKEPLQSTVKAVPKKLKWPTKPASRMKQYGDKGYKPSTGKGVGM